MLFQPSNIYPSTFSGIGAGTVDVTQGLNVSWQVNGDTPMTAYQIKIYQNDSGSTLMYDSGSVTVSPAFEPHDKYGNATYFTAIISAAALSTAGIVNGYQYGYKMLITQWWGVSDYVEQTSASVFITRSTPTLTIDTITTPVSSSSLTITASYSQAQGDPISTVEWVFALAGSESTPIRKTGAISTQVLSFDADGLITGNTYSIMCKVVTSTGMEASTGFVQFPVSYSSSSLGINYQLAQLKNSSAVYLSWDNLGSNILSYPYTDTTKTTNGITFTVNGEGDVVVTGTATADAYFTIAQGTLSQLGITAGQKFIVTSGYSGAKIVVTETNSSNVVVSTITGNDPLQYIATSTTNTLKFSIVIPSGTSFGTSQQLQPMIAIEDKIVALNDVSVTMQPIQDLNGYSSPWPAGGGKNKLPPNYSGGASLVTNHVTYTNTDGVVNVTGTPTGNAYYGLFPNTDGQRLPLPAGTYTISCQETTANCKVNFNVVGVVASVLNANQHSYTFTLSSDGEMFANILTNGNSAVNLTLHIQIESGSTATSWEPYENICPITGRTGVTVYRTGKNLLPQANNATTLFTVADDGTISQDNPSSASFAWNYTNSIMRCTLPAGTYTFTETLLTDATNYAHGVRVFTDSNVQVGIVVAGAETAGEYSNTFTFTETTSIGITIKLYSATAKLSIVQGSSPSSYEPYNGNTYSVDWTSEAGTVYGGTLDVVSGVLTVTHVCDTITKDSAWYSFNTGTGNSSAAVQLSHYDTVKYVDGSSSYNGAIASTGKELQNYWVNARQNESPAHDMGFAYSIGGQVRFHRTDVANITDLASFKANFPDTQICYELATPLTYQLTAQEVAALVGTNNVWSTGESVTVTYTKDTGSQATLSGAIVTFSDSNAVLIPTPQYIPGITGISIYRYLQGESALQHVYDLATGATSILDYYAPSQMQVSYLIVAHSGIGDLFLQTTKFTPTFWFFSILLCDTDSNGDYHVSKEYIFKYGVETGAVSNNNDPTIQKNFTPYPNRQPISTLYKTGKVSGYIGKTNNLNQYSDSISLQNAIYDISVSTLDKFLKSRKGDVIKVDTASSIQMKTEDNTVQQALRATVDWVEVGDASNKSIVSVPSDSFWPIS